MQLNVEEVIDLSFSPTPAKKISTSNRGLCTSPGCTTRAKGTTGICSIVFQEAELRHHRICAFDGCERRVDVTCAFDGCERRVDSVTFCKMLQDGENFTNIYVEEYNKL